MSKIETGGPAFPGKAYSGLPNEGLSLRDYFAAKALANLYTHSESSPDKVADWAYQIADAMLEARK